MARTPLALASLTSVARRAASIFRSAGSRLSTERNPEPLFEALEERTLLAADIQATVTVPALTGLASAGGTLSGSILLRNTGNAAANGFTYRVFLSTDSVVGNEDDVELTGVDGLTASLASGATSTVNLNTFTIPTDIRPGAYFLIVQLDTTNAVAEGEAGEGNNTVRSASPNIVLNGPAAATPNLNATVTFTNRVVGPDQQISVPTTIRNTGAAASGQIHVTWVISTNDIIGDADDIAIDSEVISNIAAGGSVTFNRNVQLPSGVPLGSYRVGVWVDDRADAAESNEGDNRAISAANALVVALPDLTSTLVTSGGSIAPGSYFTGTLTVRNLTQGSSGSFYVTISLSADGIAGNDDDIELMSVRVADPNNPDMGLAGNASRVFSNLRMYIPYGAFGGGALNPGAYRVVVTVDSDEEIDESSESNNQTISSTASVTIPARNTANDPEGADLSTYIYPISGTYQPGQVITVSAIIANLGNAAATNPIFSAYLSSDNTLDGGDVLLSSDVFGNLGNANPGSLFATANLTIPGAAPNGTFYVILVADEGDDIEETNENNNTAAAGTATVSRPTISITAPDAAAAEITTGTANGGQFRITRTGPTTSDLVVHYTVSGTAGDDDFNADAFTGTVTIPAGQTFVVLNLSAVNDALAENDETVIVTISNDPFYTVSGTQSHATVTIADNEPRVSITAVRATGVEGGTATTAQGQFRVTRTGSTAQALTVTFSLTGTADDGVDYNVTGTGVTYDPVTHTGTVIIPIGQTSATFNIDVVDDSVGEDPETVIATPVADEDLYSVSATAGSATVTINDNEALVTVTAPDAAAAETTGAANGGQYRITRTGSTTGALVVHFIMQGTASSADDYVLSSSVTGANLTFDSATGIGTVTIPAGALFVTVNLAVDDDSIGENPETAIFRLDNDDAYRLGTTAQRSATVTIADNEPMVTLQASDTAAAEHQGLAPANPGQFRVTRPATNTAGDLVVHFTMSGTAALSGDYTLTAAPGGTVTYDPVTGEGTVTILSGQTTAVVNLVVTNDSTVEPSETAIMTLENDAAYRVSTVASQRIATVTIADNEPIVSLTATDRTATEGLVNGVNDFGNFRVSRTGDLSQELHINVVVTGTAINGDWINFITTEMVIPAGQAFYDNPVIAVDDTLWEGAETITITLATGTGYTLTSVATQRTATVTINDNESTIAVRAQDPTAAEVTTGTQNPGQYRFTRTLGSNVPAVTVYFQMSGTASFTDYTLSSGAAGSNVTFDDTTGLGSITIPAGASTVDLNLVVDDDAEGEAAERAIITIVADPGYRLALSAAQRTATVTINDNEATVALTTNDTAAAEVTTGTANGGRYTFTRSLASNAQALVVHFTITGTATALAGADFTLSSGATLTFDDATGLGTITIPAGSNTAVLNVNVVDDATAESAETVVLTVNAADGYRLATAAAQRVGTVTIADNEPTVTVAGRDVAAAEVFTGTANPAVFRITRTGATTNPLVVTYALTGTATAGDDYTVLSTTTVTIPAGSLFVDVTINVTDDLLVEGSENVTLTLVADTTYRLSATATQRAATAVISDNEPTFAVTAPDSGAAEGNTNTGTFRIARTGGNSQITVVHFTITGTADPLNDFTLSSTTPGANLTFDEASGTGTITFTGSTTFVNITLTANTDGTTEGVETAIITIVGADDGEQEYNISGTQSAATISIANTAPLP